MRKLHYRVGDLRAVGLEARWAKTSDGAPIILARNPNSDNAHQRETWWAVDQRMWARAQEVGIKEAFDGATLLGGIFSVPA